MTNTLKTCDPDAFQGTEYARMSDDGQWICLGAPDNDGLMTHAWILTSSWVGPAALKDDLVEHRLRESAAQHQHQHWLASESVRAEAVSLASQGLGCWFIRPPAALQF